MTATFAGVFHGLAKHADTSLIPIRFEISRLDMQSSPRLFAVCIGFERGIDHGFVQPDREAGEEGIRTDDGFSATTSSSEGHYSDGETKFLIGDEIESSGLDFTVPIQRGLSVSPI